MIRKLFTSLKFQHIQFVEASVKGHGKAVDPDISILHLCNVETLKAGNLNFDLIVPWLPSLIKPL